jgi:uncharacterized protein (DUF433 family)
VDRQRLVALSSRRNACGPFCAARPAHQAAGGHLIQTLGSRKSTIFPRRAKLTSLEAIMDSSLVKRDPEIMSGALCFTGTRVPVKNLFDYLEGSSSLEEFLEDFPSVSRDRAVKVLEAARERLAADAPAA